MIETLFAFLGALAFGMGITLCLFGILFCYRVFFAESAFESPIVPMAVSFAFLTLGLTFLYLVIV